MAKLIVESGGSRREHALSNPCRIGRDDENDLVLNDPGSSRRHCRIAKDGDAWILEDLHSANGTYRNDERIDRVRLAEGDVIRIGGSKLTFRAAEAAVADDEIQLEDPGSPAAGASWRLIGVTGEVKGRRFDVAGSRLTVGRKGSNTIPLGDNKVSGVHCEIVIEAGRPVLRDLGSTNGTYLEGKRIDEIALSHGDRFGLGECVFVVADASQPEPELERRDADSERTMIQEPGFHRDVVDEEMDQVSRANVDAVRKGSSVLGTLVMLLLVAGIAGAGWYWIDQRSRAAAAAEVPPAPGNLLADRWSFEATEALPAPTSAWDLATDGPEGEARESFALATGAAKSGEGALRAAFDHGAVAALRDAIPSANRRYTISGLARTDGEAVALLVAHFRSKEDPSYGLRTVVGSAQGGAFTALGGPVVTPSDADELVLELVAAGNGGAVVFDDLSVVADGVEQPAQRQAGAFAVETFGDSVLYRRNNETLLRAASPVVIANGRRFGSDLYRFGSKVLAGAAGAAEIAVDVATDPRKITQTIKYSYDSGRIGGVVLPLELLGALLEHDLNVLSNDRGLEPYSGPFEVGGVTALVVGKGATRMRLAFQPAIAIKATRDERRYLLELALPAASPQLKIEAQVDFLAEVVDAANATDAAEAAFRAGKLGDTLGRLKSIRETYAFDENALAKAEALRQNVEIELARLEREVQEAAARARYLRSDSTFREAIELATATAAKFEGTEKAAVITAEAERLATENATIRAGRDRTDAERLLARMTTALAQVPPRAKLAESIVGHLETRYPDSTAASEARKRFDASGAKTGGN